MHAEQKKLYALLITATTAGYLWLLYHIYFRTQNTDTTVCLVKSITGIACPSCGTTRSILSIFNGNWKAAMYYNPLGLIVLLIMIILPIGLLYDVILKKQTCWTLYKKAEQTLQKKTVAIPLIIVVLANWIWNIYKHV